MDIATDDRNASIVASSSGPVLLPGVQTALNIFIDYVVIVIGVLGLLNNGLSALVFTIFYSKFPPSCLYFVVLSVSDFFTLSFLCILLWMADSIRNFGLQGFDLFGQSLWGCRTMRYLQMIFMTLGAYTMVVLSFERAACLLSPVRFISFFTVRRRIAVVSVVTLVAAALWIQTFVGFDLRPRYINGSILNCYPSLQVPPQYSLAFNYQMIFINYTIPALLILIGNILAFCGYRMNRMSRLQSAAHQDRSSNTESDVKVTMVMLSLQYLILNLPYSVSWPLFSFLKFFGYEVSRPSFFFNMSYLNTIFMVIAYMNLSINFYFYLFKVRRFKRYLMRLTIGLCSRCRNSGVRSSQGAVDMRSGSSTEGRSNRLGSAAMKRGEQDEARF